MIPALTDKLSTVEELCRRHHVATLEVFGSALTGQFLASSSDIDFLVRFEALPVRDYAENFFSLKDDLEALFDRTVDLVESEPLRNPYFIEQIRSARSPVYVA